MSGKGRSDAWDVRMGEDRSSGDNIPVHLRDKDYKPPGFVKLEAKGDDAEWWQEQREEPGQTSQAPKFIFTVLDPRNNKEKFVAELDSKLVSHRVRMVVQWLKWEMQYQEFKK